MRRSQVGLIQPPPPACCTLICTGVEVEAESRLSALVEKDVLNTALYLTGHLLDAEDVAREVYIKIFRSRNELERAQNVKRVGPWVTTVRLEGLELYSPMQISSESDPGSPSPGNQTPVSQEPCAGLEASFTMENGETVVLGASGFEETQGAGKSSDFAIVTAVTARVLD